MDAVAGPPPVAPSPIQVSPGVPVPEVGDFIMRHPTTRRPRITYPGGTKTYTLRTSSDTPAYRITDDTSNPTWSLFEDYPVHEIDIRVRGCIVWLLPRGARFCHQPHISGMSGGGRDCLVIVAGRNGPVTNTVFDEYGMDSAGIWFQGGLQTDIPVILVSNGKVVIWHDNEYAGATVNTWADDLSIFAGSVSLMGPEQTNWMRPAPPGRGEPGDHAPPPSPAERRPAQYRLLLGPQPRPHNRHLAGERSLAYNLPP